jgi:FMN phosphatase YigB (HAD superfamily)
LDSVISSHDYGQPKEDQRFWQQLQNNINFNPERTLFIDDSEAVLHSAEKYGIAHLLSIEQPDSKTARHTPSKFPMLDSFAHLMTSDGLA